MMKKLIIIDGQNWRKSLGVLSIILLQKPDDNEAAFIHRSEYTPDRVLLYFNYNDKYYQIKVENGVPIVEERKSQDDLDPAYMWIASL